MGCNGAINSALHGGFGLGIICMALALNAEQSKTPLQGLTGCGSRQRKLPTGGAAKGIPLKLYMFAVLSK